MKNIYNKKWKKVNRETSENDDIWEEFLQHMRVEFESVEWIKHHSNNILQMFRVKDVEKGASDGKFRRRILEKMIWGEYCISLRRIICNHKKVISLNSQFSRRQRFVFLIFTNKSVIL